jgi:hypothetical protein
VVRTSHRLQGGREGGRERGREGGKEGERERVLERPTFIDCSFEKINTGAE